jgi:ribonuclease H-related protein
MGKKVYAIKEGFDALNNIKINNRIVNTWDECLRYVKGVKGAKYKSFTTVKEAQEYLEGSEVMKSKGNFSPQLNQVLCYVDGSFNAITNKYSYALVVVKNDVIVYLENGCSEDDSMKDIRQIAGELRAAVRSTEYCSMKGIKEFVLLHDYIGVCNHAMGLWERKEESSKEYYKKMNDLMKENNLQISFVKVDSHTGELYNEIADELAKIAGGIPLKGVVKSYLKNKSLLVQDENIKEKILSIAGSESVNNIGVIST